LSRVAKLGTPQALNDGHVLDQFDSGREALNQWLRTRALANQKADYTRVIVVTHLQEVVGYYGLSLSSVQRGDLPRKLRSHPAPNPIPCLLLGQLAVDRRWQGKGIGIALLKDALIRAVKIAEHAGTRAVVVNALDEAAAQFWTRVGFLATPHDSQTFFRTIADIRASLAASLVEPPAHPD
jgi:predicted N-acetyltransferase YhbS